MASITEEKVSEQNHSVFDLTSLARALEDEEEPTLEAPTLPLSSSPPSPSACPFLDLPPEIRYHIYSYALLAPRRPIVMRKFTVRPTTSGISRHRTSVLRGSLNLFLTCRRVHDEATHYLYSSQTFRLFSVADMADVPMPQGLSRRYKALITIGQVVLGPNWTAPPESWAVDPKDLTSNHVDNDEDDDDDDGDDSDRGALGLRHMKSMRLLKVFITCDPSQPVFEGFRISEHFYTDFAGALLHDVLAALPSVRYVEFDAFPSVDKLGPLMSRLMQVVSDAGRRISWGPLRNWGLLDRERE